MTAATAGPRDVDSGRIWAVFEAVALVVGAAALAIVVLLLVSTVSVEVDGGQPRDGRRAGDGTLLECPPPVDWLRDRPEPLCEPGTRSVLRAVPGAGAVASLASGAVVVAHRRRRWLKDQGAALAGTEEVCSYRQDSMPWGYWCAVPVFGAMGLLMVATGLVASFRDGANLRSSLVFAAVVYVVVWVYGRRRAYELVLVGDEIEWRAPLRRRRLPVRSLVSAEVRVVNRLLAERQASLLTVSGEELVIVIPNARHERRFLAFCEAVERRARSFSGPGTRSRAPV